MDKKPITILFLDHTAVLSGAELSLLNLVQRLNRTRFVSTVLLFADGPLAEALREAGLAVEILPLADSVRAAGRRSLGAGSLVKLGAAFSSATFTLRLARHIRRHRPDIVHCNSLKADILGGLAGRLAGAKVIWHIRDRIETDYLPARVVKIFRRLARVIPHYVIANSNATLETLHLPPAKPCAVVYPSVPAECRVPGQDAPRGTGIHARVAGTPVGRDAHATENAGGPVVVLVGRISPWKGQDIFIRAAAIVLQQFPACQFQIVGAALFGENALDAELKQLAASLGVAERIDFMGFRKDVPAIIAGSTLLVHASTVPEPFGQVIVQAMAEGKPVVATRGGGVLEIVDEGNTGLLVPMKDAEAMAQAICQVLADPERAQRMGAAGRARFLERFTIERTVEAIERTYVSMVADQYEGMKNGFSPQRHEESKDGGETILTTKTQRHKDTKNDDNDQ